MRKLFLLIAVLFSVPCAGLAQPPGQLPQSFRAVARQFSHGISCTCIWTGPGRSFFLGCAHGYTRPEDMRTRITLDVPSPSTSGEVIQSGGTRLVWIDYKADLSLVEMLAGPLPYVAPVAPIGRRTRLCLSCGYDNMTLPGNASPLVRYAHIVDAEDDGRTYTAEKPWHGRSGGGLLDADTGELIGTCTGYEDGPGNYNRGIYTSLGAVTKFLTAFEARYAQGGPVAVPQQQYQQPRRQQWLPQMQPPIGGGGNCPS